MAQTDEPASVERTAAITPAADCQARLPRLKMTRLGSGVCIAAMEDDCLIDYSITSSARALARPSKGLVQFQRHPQKFLDRLRGRCGGRGVVAEIRPALDARVLHGERLLLDTNGHRAAFRQMPMFVGFWTGWTGLPFFRRLRAVSARLYAVHACQGALAGAGQGVSAKCRYGDRARRLLRHRAAAGDARPELIHSRTTAYCPADNGRRSGSSRFGWKKSVMP
jgi:hypothetical protein